MIDDANIFTYGKQMGLLAQKLKYLKKKNLYYIQASNLPNGPCYLNKMFSESYYATELRIILRRKE